MIEELRIVEKKRHTQKITRKASENDYDCVFKKESQTGIYYGYINADYNINSPEFMIVKNILTFNPSQPEESLRYILQNIDSDMLKRNYISRCVILIYKTKDEIFCAKIGGGFYCFSLFPSIAEGLNITAYELLKMKHTIERDFFCGSGAVLPYVEKTEGSAKIVICNHLMRQQIEMGFDDEMSWLMPDMIGDKLNKVSIHNFTNDIYDFVFKGGANAEIDAYLCFV